MDDIKTEAPLYPGRLRCCTTSAAAGATDSFRADTVRTRKLFAIGPYVRMSLAVGMLLLVSGCSLVAITGKMLFGDPVQHSQFKKATHADLVKSQKKVLVLCSAADSIRANYPSVEFDILDGMTCRLKAAGIKMVSTGAVAEWLDDHGGRFDDLGKLAEKFHADFVIHIDLSKFTCEEDNSPDLLRGHSEGRVLGYHLSGTGSDKRLIEVMTSDFVSVYPQGNPVSVNSKSAKIFTQEYINRLSLKLALLFYDHPMSEEIE